MIYLVLGHLRTVPGKRYRNTIDEIMVSKALKEDVILILEQRFGYSPAEGAALIEQFIDDHFARTKEGREESRVAGYLKIQGKHTTVAGIQAGTGNGTGTEQTDCHLCLVL